MSSLLSRTGRIVRVGIIGAIVVGIIRMLRGPRQPAVTGEASWPPLADDAAPEPVVSSPAAEQEPAREAAPAAVVSRSERGAEADEAESGWVDPIDGVCPASHPIKGNAQSNIFHVPGGASYDRTVPERCYASPEAAEADGMRAAKR